MGRILAAIITGGAALLAAFFSGYGEQLGLIYFAELKCDVREKNKKGGDIYYEFLPIDNNDIALIMNIDCIYSNKGQRNHSIKSIEFLAESRKFEGGYYYLDYESTVIPEVPIVAPNGEDIRVNLKFIVIVESESYNSRYCHLYNNSADGIINCVTGMSDSKLRLLEVYPDTDNWKNCGNIFKVKFDTNNNREIYSKIFCLHIFRS